MRRLSLWGRSKPAGWICSVAILATASALADDSAGPLLFPDAPATVSESQAAPGMTEAERIREARRLLLDFPGSDPLAAAANEVLFFGAGPDNAPAAQPPAIMDIMRLNAAQDNLADDDQIHEIEIGEVRTGNRTNTRAIEPNEITLDGLPVKEPHGISQGPHRPQSTIPQPANPKSTSYKTAEPQSAKPDNFSPEMLKLCDNIRTVLGRYYVRHQNARDNSPWEVMHAIIAYGVDTQIYRNGPNSEKVNAIGYMAYNYPCRDQRMLLINRGKVDASRGVGVQGHAGQFLAILAQSHVKRDYPLMVEGKKFTLEDLIQREMETCVAGEELTFKLIALSHYLDSDATWTTPNGQTWSIERLVREELKAPIRGAACGGTHRLMGYSYALRKRTQQGKPITGDFQRAQIYLRDYHRYTFGLQNPDGSFSTAWFERRAAEPSIDRRIKTTGHILEWIAFSLSDQELLDPRTVKAVDYLTNLMLTNDRHTWEIGPLGHALHALMIYENRVFKDVVPMPEPSLAEDQQSALWHEARRSESR